MINEQKDKPMDKLKYKLTAEVMAIQTDKQQVGKKPEYYSPQDPN